MERGRVADGAWALYHRIEDGVPAAFVDILRDGLRVERRRGRALTWGEEDVVDLPSVQDGVQRFEALRAQARGGGHQLAAERGCPPHDVGLADLTAILQEGARSAFEAVRGAHPEVDLDRWALVSDESAMSIYHVAGSVQSVAEAGFDDAKFIPAEWPHGGGDALLDTPSRVILGSYRRASESDEDGAFAAHRTKVFEACIAALDGLRAEGAFGKDDFVCFGVSDSDAGDDSLPRLNSGATLAEWQAWRATW